MGKRVTRWISTEQAGASIGMSSEWIRAQIEAKRLRAYCYETGARRTYRIRTDDWERFLVRYRKCTDDPDWG
jgi:hypothetical protein